MSARSERNRSAAWRLAGITIGAIIIYLSAFAQGLKACTAGWLSW